MKNPLKPTITVDVEHVPAHEARAMVQRLEKKGIIKRDIIDVDFTEIPNSGGATSHRPHTSTPTPNASSWVSKLEEYAGTTKGKLTFAAAAVAIGAVAWGVYRFQQHSHDQNTQSR